jgi:hypothetical protein
MDRRLDVELPGMAGRLGALSNDSQELFLFAIRFQLVMRFGWEVVDQQIADAPDSYVFAVEWATDLDERYLDNSEADGAFASARAAAAVALSVHPDVAEAISQCAYEAIHGGIDPLHVVALVDELERFESLGPRKVPYIGLWWSIADQDLPDPWWFVGADQTIHDRAGGVPAFWFMGFSTCRFCDARNGNAAHTDGHHVWPEGLDHYAIHGVRVARSAASIETWVRACEGIIADLVEPDSTSWRRWARLATGFAEAVAVWSAGGVNFDSVVDAARRIVQAEAAGPEITQLALANGGTAEMVELVDAASKELGTRFDPYGSEAAARSAIRVRCASTLRQRLDGWALVDALADLWRLPVGEASDRTIGDVLADLEQELLREERARPGAMASGSYETVESLYGALGRFLEDRSTT